MLPFSRILQGNKLFFIGFAVFLIACILGCLVFSKSSSFIALNFVHTSWLNNFFTFYTFLGDGLLAVIIFAVLLVFRRYLIAIQLILAFLPSGIVAQVIKNLTHAPRPRVFFKPAMYSNFIDGVTQTGWASFPSGHATTAFALATILALHTRNKRWSILFLFLAIGEAYSRIYLGQHFLVDVAVGSLIGVFFALGIFLWVRPLKLFRWNLVEDPASSVIAIQ